MPGCYQALPPIPDQGCPPASPEHSVQHPAQMTGVVQVAPPQQHPSSVGHHQGPDTQAGGEGDHGQEDDAELGVWLEGGEHSYHTADGATGPETEADTPCGHFVGHTGQAGDHSATQVDSQELLGTKAVDRWANEAGNKRFMIAKNLELTYGGRTCCRGGGGCRSERRPRGSWGGSWPGLMGQTGTSGP